MPVADYVKHINTTSAHLIQSSEARDDMTAELIATLTPCAKEIELAMIIGLTMAVRR
jgi:hypothetical protein